MTRYNTIIFCLFLIASDFSLLAQVSNLHENPSDTISQVSKIQTGLSSPVNGHQGLSSVIIEPAGTSYTNQLSIFDYLQGKISGLDITGASDRGRNPLTIFRGQQILGKRLPLIVIDGIPWKTADPLFNQYNEGQEEIQSVIPISIEDIASVEVLKDDASLVLYGTEGADGVILIETKKGIEQKLHLTYQYNQGIIKKPEFLPMLNGDEYIMYQLEGLHNAGYNDIPSEIAYDPDDVNFYNYSANTDWLKAITQQGYTSDHYLNLTGGNKKNKFFSSVNFLDQKGNLINSDYSRFLSRLNYEHEFTEKLMFRFLLNYNKDKYRDNVIVINDYGQSKSILDMAFIKAPNMSIREYDSYGNATDDFFTPINNYQGSSYEYFNPVAVSNIGYSKHTHGELSSTAQLQYDIKEWLSLTESFTLNQSTSAAKAFLPFYAVGGDWAVSDPVVVGNNNHLKFRQLMNKVQALIKIPFRDQKKNSLNGAFTWDKQNEGFSVKSDLNSFIVIPDDRNFNAIVSSVQYKLLEKYIFISNARFESAKSEDQSSEWDKHIGFTMGWRFTEEPFIKRLGIAGENGSLHAGWSYSQFQPHLYPPMFYYITNTKYQTSSLNAGIELGLFDDRMHMTYDFYCKGIRRQNSYLYQTNDVFRVRNKGLEVAFDYSIIRKRTLNWNVSFNLAHHTQKLVEAPDNINNRESAHIQSGQYVYYLNEGRSPDAIYGLDYEGVYSTDEEAISPNPVTYGTYIFKGGDAKYRDVNHDGAIDDHDLVNLGNTYPKFTGGLGSSVRFKNLSLTCNFYFRTGYKIIDQAEMESEGLNTKHNQNRNVLNRWRIQGQQGRDLVPRAYLGHPANNLPSDRWVKNGSFLRMNYINLTYQLGPEICRKIHVHDFRISLSGQRLFTLTSYDGLDPETELEYSGIFSMNRDEMRLYPPEIYSIGFQITI